MVKISALLKQNNQLDEHNEVKALISKQIAEHLQGGYVDKLLETLTSLHNRNLDLL